MAKLVEHMCDGCDARTEKQANAISSTQATAQPFRSDLSRPYQLLTKHAVPVKMQPSLFVVLPFAPPIVEPFKNGCMQVPLTFKRYRSLFCNDTRRWQRINYIAGCPLALTDMANAKGLP